MLANEVWRRPGDRKVYQNKSGQWMYPDVTEYHEDEESEPNDDDDGSLTADDQELTGQKAEHNELGITVTCYASVDMPDLYRHMTLCSSDGHGQGK